VVEGIERQHVGARPRVGDEPAGQPAIGIDPADLAVQIDPKFDPRFAYVPVPKKV
jgi:hypothetical protein